MIRRALDRIISWPLEAAGRRIFGESFGRYPDAPFLSNADFDRIELGDQPEHVPSVPGPSSEHTSGVYWPD